MESPSVVAAALLQAAAAATSLRPAALPEIAAFALREKPALRFVIEPDDEACFERAAAAVGLECACQSVYLESRGGSWFSLVSHRTEKRRALIVIAPAGEADRLVRAESEDAERAGVLLGYPRCCVSGFQRLAESGGLWGQALAATATDTRAIDARCNRYAAEWGGIGVLGELFPCSLECELAKDYGERLYQSTLRLGLHRLAERAMQDSLRPVELSDDGTVRVAASGTADCLRFAWKSSSR